MIDISYILASTVMVQILLTNAKMWTCLAPTLAASFTNNQDDAYLTVHLTDSDIKASNCEQHSEVVGEKCS